jgi:hypothetical protein
MEVFGSARNYIFAEDNNCVQERFADKSADKGNLNKFDRTHPVV